jgi:hypothetical protein
VIKLSKFKEQKLYVIIIIAVFCLLLFAIVIALNLVTSPVFSSDVVAIGAVTVAVVLIMIMYAIDFIEKRKGALSEVANKQVIGTVKEPDEAAVEVLSAVNIQKSAFKVELNKVEQKNQLAKQLMSPTEKLICPACRKDFNPPFIMTEFIVDFGPASKVPRKIVYCPHCDQPISLKQKSVMEADVWK